MRQYEYEGKSYSKELIEQFKEVKARVPEEALCFIDVLIFMHRNEAYETGCKDGYQRSKRDIINKIKEVIEED